MKPLKDSELKDMMASGAAMSTSSIAKLFAPDGGAGSGGHATDRAPQHGVDPEFSPGNA